MVFKIADTYNYRQLWWLDKLLIGHKGYIAGGCFKNIFNNERVKDVDIFFENKADCLEAISYLAMLDPKNQKDFEKELGKSLYDGLD